MAVITGLEHEEALEILEKPTPSHLLDYYDQPYVLTNEQIDLYQKNGFITLKNMLEGEALAYARKVFEAAVLIKKEKDKRALAEKSQYEQSFLQCGYLAYDFPAAKDFVFGKRFARAAKELMQLKGVRLWHDQALFKEPHGRITDVHQDSSYWPVAKPELTTTLWLALVDVPVEKGCLYFHPGTHASGEREYVDIFQNPHTPESLKEEQKVFAPLKAGDATYHSGLVFHGAGKNTTDDIREGMTVIYMDAEMKFDDSDERNKTHKSCQGLRGGEKIDTSYTPVLS